VAAFRRVDVVDVAAMNAVDWTKLADQNIGIAITRFREFSTTIKLDDVRFRAWWPQMRKTGMVRGAFLLVDPVLNATRAQIEAEAQHFIDVIDSVGGLEPGDLPLSVDFEQVGNPPPNAQTALNQLAWLLNALTPYVRQQMRQPNAFPFLYTGRNTWINVVADHAAAFTTNDADPATRVTVNFSDYPLWWAWLDGADKPGGFVFDPTNTAHVSAVRFPVAWRGTTNSFLLQYTGADAIPTHEAEDASVVANVDAAGAVTLGNNFSPLLALARVAPPTADIQLSRVTELSDQPPDQVFSLLLIGQGFWADEFEQVVQEALFGKYKVQGGLFEGFAVGTVHARQGVFDIAPFNQIAAVPGKNAFACYYDAGTHADGTGLSLPLRQESVRGTGKDPITGNNIFFKDPVTGVTSADMTGPVDQLRIAHPPLSAPQVLVPGRTLAEYLSHLTVKLADGTIRRATEFWPVGQRRTGAKGSLIAVLRKAPYLTRDATTQDDPKPAELYQLDPTTDDPVPFVAVNVVPFGDWPLVLARAIAQNLAAVADEYELEGAGFAQPAEGVANPLGPNLVTIDDTQRQALAAGTAAAVAVPQVFTAWNIPKGTAVDFVANNGPAANPLPAWNVTSPFAPGADFHAVEGGGGYRTHVLRCDKDCLMRRMPAAVSDIVETAPALPPALPIQSTLRVFCKACEDRLSRVITGRTNVALAPRVELDAQRRLFDALKWPTLATPGLQTINLASASALAPQWSCTAEFAAPAGFRFTDIDLFNVDYWVSTNSARFAHVLKSVTFENLEVEFADAAKTKRPLSIATALASTKPAPTFETSNTADATGHYQVGARLRLTWLVTHSAGHTCVVDAELSLVLAAMDNDIDPAGMMMGCRLYPQIAMRARASTPGTPAVAALRGTITLVANNADPSNLTGTLQALATGKLTTSLFCESNRASAGAGVNPGLALDNRQRAALVNTFPALPSRLMPPPHWSWIYDYCNAGIIAPVKPFAAVLSTHDGARGTSARESVTSWPLLSASGPTIHKLPRQGAYDSLCIHPDRGNDVAGKLLAAAPYCADLGLHLQWRHGLSSSGGPAPFHLFRGWGAGRLGQGAQTVLAAPVVPPNQHVDVEIIPTFDRSSVTVKYSVTASEVLPNRWQVFLEQGLAYAFQYVVSAGLAPTTSAFTFADLGVLSETVGATKAADVIARLAPLVLQPANLDAAIRDVWLSIQKRLRWFDQALDGTTVQQIPDGPTDLKNFENL
jgi:hypothetical protein